MKKNNNDVDYSNIGELIKKIAGTYGKSNVKLFDGTVRIGSLDLEKRTCIVDSIDNSLDGIEVRFMLEQSDGDMSVPSEDSTVTVAMTDFTDPYIVSSTWIDRKVFVVGTQSLDIQKEKQIFNDGSFGGIPKIIDPNNSNIGLLKKYNNLEKKTNDLIAAINGWIPVPNDGGLALKTALTTWLSTSLSITIQSDIENPLITHGK